MRRVSRRFKNGQVVQVQICKGLSSGLIGRVVDRREVRTDGRGVPLIPGHYKPMYPDEIPLRDVKTGELFTMFARWLDLVPLKKRHAQASEIGAWQPTAVPVLHQVLVPGGDDSSYQCTFETELGRSWTVTLVDNTRRASATV